MESTLAVQQVGVPWLTFDLSCGHTPLLYVLCCFVCNNLSTSCMHQTGLLRHTPLVTIVTNPSGHHAYQPLWSPRLHGYSTLSIFTCVVHSTAHKKGLQRY